VSGLVLRTFDSAEALHYELASSLVERIQGRNALNLPTRLLLGAPAEALAMAAELCNARGISWRNVHLFLFSEWLDWQGRLVEAAHPLSQRTVLRREVLELLGEPLRPALEQFHFPHPMNPDSMAARIAQAGGLDFAYLPLEIPPPLGEPDRVTGEAMKRSGARIGPSPAGAPFPLMMVAGMREIFEAKVVRLYGTKAPPGGPATAAFPATLLESHPDAEAAVAII
jgi:hypothetical protein